MGPGLASKNSLFFGQTTLIARSLPTMPMGSLVFHDISHAGACLEEITCIRLTGTSKEGSRAVCGECEDYNAFSDKRMILVGQSCFYEGS